MLAQDLWRLVGIEAPHASGFRSFPLGPLNARTNNAPVTPALVLSALAAPAWPRTLPLLSLWDVATALISPTASKMILLTGQLHNLVDRRSRYPPTPHDACRLECQVQLA